MVSQYKLISVIYSFQPRASHLLYADDLIICKESSCDVAKAIKDIFQRFEEITGLKLNELKSKWYFNKFRKSYCEVLNMLKVRENGHPVKYLRVPLSSYKIMDREYAKLLTKIRGKLQGWRSRLLLFS